MTPPASLWFVDTNVLLYRYDGTHHTKQETAHAWLRQLAKTRSGRLSWQVLNEFYDNAIKKLGAPPAFTRQVIGLYAEWNPVPFSLALLQRAWHWTDHAQLRYWDALILASAETLGCRWLLSEDFQEGRKYGNVQVVNPFSADPAEYFG